MSFSECHFRYILSASALVLFVVGCQTTQTDGDGRIDCAPIDCAPDGPPGISHFEAAGDNQLDRPFSPPAIFPRDEAVSPLRADSPADVPHPEEGESTEPASEPPLDSEIFASRLEARGAQVTRDSFLSVVTIDLSNTRVIDEDLEHLHLFGDLEQLNLTGTRISNTSLDHLSRSPKLEYLGLTGTQVDDEGVQKIRELRQLRFLSLAGTDVSDAGLESLSRMRNLEAVNLRSTRVTADGVAALQSRLPECRIVFEAGSENGRPTNAPRGAAPPASEFEPLPGTGNETSWWRNDARAGSQVARTASASRGQLDLTRLYPTPDRIEAQRQLEFVLRRKLSDPEVLHALAAVRAAEGNWREARATILAALEQQPDDPGLQFDYAVTLAQCQALEAAFEQFERAVGGSAAHYNLGVLLVEQGRFAAGRSHFLEAVALNPTLDAARDWLAFIEGDELRSPHDAGGPGLLTDQEFRSLFGSLLGGDSTRQEAIEIRPADVAHATAEPSSMRPVTGSSSPFGNPPAPINWDAVGSR